MENEHRGTNQYASIEQTRSIVSGSQLPDVPHQGNVIAHFLSACRSMFDYGLLRSGLVCVHAAHPPNIHTFFALFHRTNINWAYPRLLSNSIIFFHSRFFCVLCIYVVANTERTIFFFFCFFPSFKNYLFNSSRWGPLTIKKTLSLEH